MTNSIALPASIVVIDDNKIPTAGDFKHGRFEIQGQLDDPGIRDLARTVQYKWTRYTNLRLTYDGGRREVLFPELVVTLLDDGRLGCNGAYSSQVKQEVLPGPKIVATFFAFELMTAEGGILQRTKDEPTEFKCGAGHNLRIGWRYNQSDYEIINRVRLRAAGSGMKC